MKLAILGLILVCAASASAQKLEVKVIDRQDKEDSYDYVAVYNNITVGKPSRFKVLHSHSNLASPDAMAVARDECIRATNFVPAGRRKRSELEKNTNRKDPPLVRATGPSSQIICC